MIQFIRELICKRKGHIFRPGRKEPSGLGQLWHWKVCERCNYACFDIEELE